MAASSHETLCSFWGALEGSVQPLLLTAGGLEEVRDGSIGWGWGEVGVSVREIY